MARQEVFITGVAGFLGSHLARGFLKEGCGVSGCDNLLGGYLDNVPEGTAFHQINCLDLKALTTVLGGEVQFARDEYDLCRGCDAVVLVTEWPQFARMDMTRAKASLRTPIIADGRNFLNPVALVAMGFRYRGVGSGYDGVGAPALRAQAVTSGGASR